MMIRRYVLLLLIIMATVPAWACSPPKQREESGFMRPQVDHLPKNALGVMFYLASGKPRPDDFHVFSARDKRPLALRVRSFKDVPWVRLELTPGFQPGARYQFRYLVRHGDWKYPDEISVAIDDTAAATRGEYAIELEPRPAYRVVVVPSSSGSCVEPSPALVQEFTYTVPQAMLPYRDVLEYGASTVTVSSSPTSEVLPIVWSWRDAPTLYDRGNFSLGLGFSKRYDTRNNAVIADCKTRQTRVGLGGSVSFPEVDEVVHRTPIVEVDLNRNVDGQCNELEALLRTVDRQDPEPGLREICRGHIVSSFSMKGQPLRTVDLDEWEFHLQFPFGMSPTCNLVGLAHLWHTGQFSTEPQTLHALGTALNMGMRQSERAQRDATVHALTYLVDQLPRETRTMMARQLLAPVQAALVDALGGCLTL